MMGGIEIFAPRDCEVTVKALSLMGAVVDKRRPATVPTTRHLIIEGFTVMGSVEIKD
jgi:hypothetical protein